MNFGKKLSVSTCVIIAVAAFILGYTARFSLSDFDTKAQAQSAALIPIQSAPQAQDQIQDQAQDQAQSSITWGVDFSQFRATNLKMDWKEVYSAIINDLGVKNIKIHTNWKLVETGKDNYSFDDIDWQLKQAEDSNVKIIYVLGMKTGRWPECHIPAWAAGLSEKDQQTELLNYIKEVVLRYKDSKTIINWQVENEPLFKFGQCPSWYYDDDDLLKTEVALVKALDSSRQIIISDSGEQSDWFGAAKIGDIVGTTMYRNTWPQGTDTFSSNAYSFLNPAIYTEKNQIIQSLFGKKVICIELQAEPWTQVPFLSASLQVQSETMTPDIFREGIQFAKQTGLDTFYFWGAEWWYWMKTTQNQSEIWNEAKNLFKI